ncbi:hypothetical protein ATC75_05285 [Klebsiella pneumoniae]|nr:hypothetical protein ATC75_05285 [Klebsiella pneumoniae]
MSATLFVIIIFYPKSSFAMTSNAIFFKELFPTHRVSWAIWKIHLSKKISFKFYTVFETISFF